jgi:superfamily II DNA or RNA helicase
MKAIVTNKFTLIQNPTDVVVRSLTDLMRYEDKAARFALRRMEKNPWLKKDATYHKLKASVEGNLLQTLSGGHLAFNSGLSYLIPPSVSIEDRRKDTGAKLAFPWKKQPFGLREYQEEAVQVCLGNWRGIVNFATGMGKTLTALHLIKRLQRKTLVIVPSDSIAKQFYKELETAFGEHRVGLYGGGKKKIREITVGIAASVTRDLDVFKNEDLGCIIFDEVHHIAASTFFDIANALGDVGRMYGLTATDYRSDGKDIMIHAGCGKILVRRDIKWGIEHGFLAKPKFLVRNIPTIGTDYKNDKLRSYKEHVLNDNVMKTQILSDIQTYIAQGKSVLCLVDEVSHGEELSKQLGIPFAQGKDKKSNDYVEQLNAGTICGLIGTDGRIGEGTDTKRVDVLILANFVASKGPVIQAIGRGLRIYGSKCECIVLDYIPQGSTMLSRHANSRIGFYKEITNDVKII